MSLGVSPTARLALDCFLMVLHPQEPAILCVHAEDGTFGLPHFTPDETDAAATQPILRAARMRLGIKATVLRCVCAFRQGEREQRYYALEMLAQVVLPGEAQWYTLPELTHHPEMPAEQRAVVTEFLAALLVEPPPLAAPWTRRGWHNRVAEWMFDLADRLDMLTTSQVEQQRSWVRAATLRLNTQQGALYFKAVPPAFSYEPVLTRVLALRYRGRVPDVVAVNVDKGWMLARGVAGQPLYYNDDLAVWLKAVRAYAEIQIDLTTNTHSLIALGVPDRNVDYLAAQIERVLVDLPPELDNDTKMQLRRSAFALRNLCYDLLDYNLPLTLVHGDFLPANILIQPDTAPIFIDWADSTISHPFFDMPGFLEALLPAHPRLAAVRHDLLNAYLLPWADYAPLPTLRKAYALAEVLTHLQRAVHYQNLVLPGIEPSARWEVTAVLPGVMRHLLAGLRAYTR